MKIIFSLIFMLQACFVLGQGTERENTLQLKCDGRVFTKTEVSPALRMSVTIYQDSLNAYMVKNNLFPIDGKVSMYLTISKDGEIIDILNAKGNIAKVEEVVL